MNYEYKRKPVDRIDNGPFRKLPLNLRYFLTCLVIQIAIFTQGDVKAFICINLTMCLILEIIAALLSVVLYLVAFSYFEFWESFLGIDVMKRSFNLKVYVHFNPNHPEDEMWVTGTDHMTS